MATIKKQSTVSFNFLIDPEEIKNVGYCQSKVFGTEYTKYYVRAKDDWSYYLYLAESTQKQVYTEMNFKFTIVSSNYVSSTYTLKGNVSLNETAFIGMEQFMLFNRLIEINHELTFEEEVPKPEPLTNSTAHYFALSQDFAALRVQSKLSDVTLVTIIDGKEFPAHSQILASRSTVFTAMFSHEELKENKNKRVDIEDISGDVMEVLLNYIYSGDTKNIDNFAAELLEAADKYDIPKLFQVCVKSMLANISAKNAAKYFYIANLHQLEKLKSVAVKFIKQNKEAVRSSDGWKQFIHCNIDLLEHLFDLMY